MNRIAFVFFILTLSLSPSLGADFESDWPGQATRNWVGPQYFANRLHDWRIDKGWLECVAAGNLRQMRTVHLLTHPLGAKGSGFEISVLVRPLKGWGEKQSEDTWAGFLIGVGGEHVDFRTSALCHQWPAPDGGLLCVADGRGRAVFRDNTKLSGRRNLKTEAWPKIPAKVAISEGFSSEAPEVVKLQLTGEVTDEGYTLLLLVIDPKTGRSLGRTLAEGVDPSWVDGNVALVSHGGTGGEGSAYAFREWRLSGESVEHHPDRTFGPIVSTQHTLSRGVLKLTAQMTPLGANDNRVAELQVRPAQNEDWKTVAEGEFVDLSCTVPFRVEGWDGSKDTPYRVVYRRDAANGRTLPSYHEGVIRKDPTDREEIVVAAFTGHHVSAQGGGAWNGNQIWYPHTELTRAVEYHKPDFLFFSGDQIYEGDMTPAVRAPLEDSTLDYLYRWYRWCWAFRDLTRDTPSVAIPDDHDVYHGNVWGAGGRHAENGNDDGGYRMPAQFVNAVQRTQTSHLPDPADSTPVEQGIGVYYTDIQYGGISFAVIEDRKWKSSPTVAVPEGNCVNGWFHNAEFDPIEGADVPGATLLGERQLQFLEDWSADWSGGTWMKVVLSQTIFANVATLPDVAMSDKVVPKLEYAEPGEYIEGDKEVADADSNGWPQTGRNRALREMRKSFAFHIAGDQHLGSFIQYGVDDWKDAPYAFCVPSTANVWPRRWFPPEPGLIREEGSPKYTGDFHDGFGNKMTVHAVSNPVRSGREPEALYDRAPGYGIVRFHRDSRDIEVECWPRWVDPSKEGAEQYFGWPKRVNQMENYGRKPVAYLPKIFVGGVKDPVVQVENEKTGEVEYTLRGKGNAFLLKVFSEGPYTLRVWTPEGDQVRTHRGIGTTQEPGAGTIEVAF